MSGITYAQRIVQSCMSVDVLRQCGMCAREETDTKHNRGEEIPFPRVSESLDLRPSSPRPHLLSPGREEARRNARVASWSTFTVNGATTDRRTDRRKCRAHVLVPCHRSVSTGQQQKQPQQQQQRQSQSESRDSSSATTMRERETPNRIERTKALFRTAWLLHSKLPDALALDAH